MLKCVYSSDSSFIFNPHFGSLLKNKIKIVVYFSSTMDEIDHELKCFSFTGGGNEVNDCLHRSVSQLPREHIYSVHCGATTCFKHNVLILLTPNLSSITHSLVCPRHIMLGSESSKLRTLSKVLETLSLTPPNPPLHIWCLRQSAVL